MKSKVEKGEKKNGNLQHRRLPFLSLQKYDSLHHHSFAVDNVNLSLHRIHHTATTEVVDDGRSGGCILCLYGGYSMRINKLFYLEELCPVRSLVCLHVLNV